MWSKFFLFKLDTFQKEEKQSERELPPLEGVSIHPNKLQRTKYVLIAHADHEGPDQHVHICRPIRAVVVRLQNLQIQWNILIDRGLDDIARNE